MDLENKEWKEFSLTSVFDKIQRGKRLKKADHIEGNIPYASSTALNNGIDDFIGNTKNVRVFKNCLTIANSGSVGSTFYQPYKVVSSDHVTKLQNKNFNKYIYLFLATMVSRLHEKYSFNREINDYRIRKEKILLPINKSGNPDYVFMENYMRKKETELITKYQKYISSKIKHLEGVLNKEVEWKEIEIKNLFNIYTGGDLILSRIIKGDIPIISHSIINNGIADWTKSIKNQKLFNHKTTISLADRGNFYAYTQIFDFYIGTRVKALEAKFQNSNKYVLNFLCVSINMQSVKFSYGNNATGGIEDLKIIIPVKESGYPDFEYMENYIKRIEQEKLMNYLKYKELNIS